MHRSGRAIRIADDRVQAAFAAEGRRDASAMSRSSSGRSGDSSRDPSADRERRETIGTVGDRGENAARQFQMRPRGDWR